MKLTYEPSPTSDSPTPAPEPKPEPKPEPPQPADSKPEPLDSTFGPLEFDQASAPAAASLSTGIHIVRNAPPPLQKFANAA
jgi:hypothetical protein